MNFQEVIQRVWIAIKPAAPDLLLIVGLVIIAVVGIKVIEHITKGLRRKIGDQLRVKLVAGSIQTVFVIVILIIMLGRIGLTEDFVKLLGLVVGGIVAFSSTSLIINLVGSAIIHMTKPFAIGHVIKVGDVCGKVEDVKPVFTVVKTFDKTLVNIPNTVFIKDQVINYSKGGFRTKASVSLSYDVDRVNAEKMLVKAASFVKLKDVFVSIIDLGDYSVTYEVIGTYNQPEDLPFIASRLRKAIFDEFNLSKVELVSPTVLVHRSVGKVLTKTKKSAVRKQQYQEQQEAKKIVEDTFGEKKKKKKKNKSKKHSKKK